MVPDGHRRVLFKIRLDQVGINRTVDGTQKNFQSTCMVLNEKVGVSDELQQVMLAMPMIRVNGYSILEAVEGEIEILTLQQETYVEQYHQKSVIMDLLIKQSFAN